MQEVYKLQVLKIIQTPIYKKLNKPFKVKNKLKSKSCDPGTSSDKALERFIRYRIKKKFPTHQVIGEEYGYKKTKSDITWVIDPIDGTRSYVIGNPSWSNLIALNFKGRPVMGLANFPILNKYYLNFSDTIASVFDKGKKRKLSVSQKIPFNQIKVCGRFYGHLSHKQQLKIPKVLKLMQFPVTDASVYYTHMTLPKKRIV